jgi:hypothetical protein
MKPLQNYITADERELLGEFQCLKKLQQQQQLPSSPATP